MTQQTFTVDYGLSIIDNSPGGGSLTGVDGAVVVTASDLANTAAWTFEPTGNLTLPSNTASINYANGTPYGGGGGGANTGNITFSGTALEITPGASETNINISPTSEGWAFVQLPNNATANTANTRVVNAAGNVTIETGDFSTGGSNVSTWTFNNAGVLTVPGEGVIRSNNDTVILESYDGNISYGLRVGTNGGVFLEQGSDPAWLSIFPNSGNAEIFSGPGGVGEPGKNLTIFAGLADQSTYNTSPGGNLNLEGGIGAFNDGGGGGPGGSVNISAGNSSDPAGVPGNVTVNTGPYTWNFDYNGTLNLPEGTAYIGSAANTLTLHANDSEAIYISSISGGISAETNGNITLISNVDGTTNYSWTFDNTGNLAAPGIITANTFVSNSYNVVTAGNLFITSQYGLGTTGTILEDNGDLEVYGSGGGGAIVGWTNNYNTLGNVATVNFNTVDSLGNIQVRTGNRAATEYNWIFDKTGNLAAPGAISATGNITGGNLNATGLSLSGNVVSAINTTANITTTANIAGGNIIGTHVGNVTGTTASLSGNVTGGNILTGGLISATGNATVGNISTAGLITATGNITVGNVNTGGRISATGNVLSNNISVTGTISATGATNATAFAVGNSAVSNVALGYFPTAGTPAEMAVRDYSTVASTMYFDNSVGSANVLGSFQFRGSNSFTQWAKIDQYGINLPTRPAFRVYGNTSTNFTTGTTLTNQVVDYNQGSNYVNSTGIFTAPVAGLYSVWLNARAGATASLSQIGVFKNNDTSGANVVCFWEITTNATQTTHFGVSSVTKLAAGDTLRAKVVAGGVNFDSNDNWGAAYIG